MFRAITRVAVRRCSASTSSDTRDNGAICVYFTSFALGGSAIGGGYTAMNKKADFIDACDGCAFGFIAGLFLSFTWPIFIAGTVPYYAIRFVRSGSKKI